MTYNIGAYYFGGWVKAEPGITWRPDPWAVNDTTNNIYLGDPEFTERKPLIGHYNEAEQWVMDHHINSAADHGIDFFAFCFYWTGTGTFHVPALENFMKSRYNHRMKFCIMFANHQRNSCDSQAQWRGAVDYWIERCFNHPRYLKIDDKPVVKIFDMDTYFFKPGWAVQNHPTKTFVGPWATGTAYSLNQIMVDSGNVLGNGVNAYYECNSAHTAAASLATDSAKWTFLIFASNIQKSDGMKWMLDDARSRAQAAGHAGIYFVGSSGAHPFWVTTPNMIIKRAGFDAFSQYRAPFTFTNQDPPNGSATQTATWKTYQETDLGHRADWDWCLANSDAALKYWPPFHAGYDKAPWTAAASRASRTTIAMPTVEQFAQHCAALKQRLDAYPTKTDQTAMCYAWNEIGEGAFLAPSGRYKFDLLKVIKETFGVRNPSRRL